MGKYKIKNLGEKTIELPSNLVHNSVRIINTILTSLIKGAQNVAEKIGQTAEDLGQDVSVVVHSLSNTTIKLSDSIFNNVGKVVKKIPLIGDSSAYIIKSGSDGVYFLVISISEISQFISKFAGKSVKTGSDIFILTLGKTNNITEQTAKDVKQISNNIFKRGKKMFRTKRRRRNRNNSKKKRKISN